MTGEVLVRVPAEHVPAVAAALRAGADLLVAQDRRRPAGTAAYDARAPLALAAQLEHATAADLAASGNETRGREGSYVTVEAAAALRAGDRSARTLRYWAQSGQIRARKAGRTWLVDPVDVERRERESTR